MHTNVNGNTPIAEAQAVPAGPQHAGQLIKESTAPPVVKLGLDLGNHQVKAAQVRNGKVVTRVFESAFAAPAALDKGDDVGLTGSIRVPTFTHIDAAGREHSFFVGDDAKYGYLPRRVPTTDSRITGEDDLRLMLYTVVEKFKVRAKLTEPPPRVYIYAGLPLHLAERGSEVAQVWEGVHQVRINSTAYHIEIAGVKTMSQPHGGLTDYFLQADGSLNPARKAAKTGTVGIIDIGYRTTDIVYLRYDVAKHRMLVDPALTVGLSDLGAQQLYWLVGRAIREQHGRQLKPEAVVEAVANRGFQQRGETIAIDAIVEAAAAHVVGNLASAVRDQAGWSDELVAGTTATRSVAIGGTPLLLGTRLKAALPYVEIPANSAVSCACGLAKAAVVKGIFPAA